MTAINSPFRYAGGKFYARKLILEHVAPHTAYIEPFAGGGSIFFAKPLALSNQLNDLDVELVNCYIQIRDHVEELIALLDGIAATKETHNHYKNHYKAISPLEKAFRWYYLNRTSYSGIMNMTNCYWGYGDKYSMRPENWPRHLRRCSEKLQGVEVTNNDFASVIEEAPAGAFLFIDPPYYNADQDKFYTHSFILHDHERLAALLYEQRGRLRFMITYDNSPEVRALYHWAECVLDKEWNYTIARTDDQTKKTEDRGKRSMGKEIFIFNYQTCSPQEASGLQLALAGLEAEQVAPNADRI